MKRAALFLALAAVGCSSNSGTGGDGGSGVDGGAGGDGGSSGSGPELYPMDRTQSPITPRVAGHLRDIAGRAAMQEDVFAKVGASATVSLNFMYCFAGTGVDLDGRDELAPTIAAFLGGDAAGTDPYERESLSATVGWSAGAALAGDPSPLDQEVAAISPRYAVIMYGTNDIQLGDIDAYGDHLLELADRLGDAGVIPLFTTIMPRDDSATADAEVPRYNLIVRGVAQSRQVPLIDFHRELAPLPDHGLGSDGIHPSVYRNPGSLPCDFTAAGLAYGYNIRNLVTITSLDRARGVVAGGDEPDPPAATLAGAGSHADPFVIPSLPFVNVQDTRTSLVSDVDSYPGCNASQDESGHEYVYRLDLATATRVHAFLSDRGGADIDVHLLSGGSTGADCRMRDNLDLVADLQPGTYYFNLDSFASGGSPLEGEYVFAVMEEPAP